MTIPHEPWLVALSIAIAIQGSFVGLSLARELDTAEGFRRRLALAGSALTLATGVWSMHFVGMLAANFPSAIDYLVLPTLISFLICVIVVGIGVYAAHASGPPALRIGARRARRWGSASASCTMSACRRCIWPDRRATSRPIVVASIVVSIGASAFALWALGSRPTRPRLFLGAVALGLAISGMHYTAMAGMRLDPLCFDVVALRRGGIGAVAQHARAARDGHFVRRLGRLSALAGSRRARAREAPQGAAPPDAPAGPVRSSPTRPGAARAVRGAAARPRRGLHSGREGRAGARTRRRRHLRHSRQRPLHLCPRRRAGIFLQPVDQRARGAPRSESVRARPSQLHRLGSTASRGSSDRAKPGVAELGVPVRCSIPIARAQYRQVKLRIEALAG